MIFMVDIFRKTKNNFMERMNIDMTEQEIKSICKWAVQNSNRQLTALDKEAIKKAIDEAKSLDDLLGIALMVTMRG